MADGRLPVCEFISTCHRGTWLMSMLKFFNSDCAVLNNGKRIRPDVVVLAFSFVSTNCVNLAFNRCSLIDYLNECWKKLTVSKWQFGCTIVKLCGAYFIKASANTMTKAEKSK